MPLAVLKRSYTIYDPVAYRTHDSTTSRRYKPRSFAHRLQTRMSARSRALEAGPMAASLASSIPMEHHERHEAQVGHLPPWQHAPDQVVIMLRS